MRWDGKKGRSCMGWDRIRGGHVWSGIEYGEGMHGEGMHGVGYNKGRACMGWIE